MSVDKTQEPVVKAEPRGLAAMVHDMALMVAFLTRLPIPVDHTSARSFPKSLWAMPLVGAGIGALVSLPAIGFASLGGTPVMAAILAVAVGVVLTGCLHEDGLGDVADGFGGGRDVEAKRTIMKDSRLGTYGSAAVILALGAKVAAFAALLGQGIDVFILGLVGAAAVSRAWPVAVSALLCPAGGQSLSAGTQPTMLCMGLALAIGLVCLVPLAAQTSWEIASCAFGAGGLAAAAMAYLAKRQIGGHTGDVLGAVQMLGEVAVLYTMVAVIIDG